MTGLSVSQSKYSAGSKEREGDALERAGGGASEGPIKVLRPSGCELWGTDLCESALQEVSA